MDAVQGKNPQRPFTPSSRIRYQKVPIPIKKCVLAPHSPRRIMEVEKSNPALDKRNEGGFLMALSNLSGWNQNGTPSPACGTACGAADKPEAQPDQKPAPCGTACGAADKPEEQPTACGAADK